MLRVARRRVRVSSSGWASAALGLGGPRAVRTPPARDGYPPTCARQTAQGGPACGKSAKRKPARPVPRRGVSRGKPYMLSLLRRFVQTSTASRVARSRRSAMHPVARCGRFCGPLGRWAGNHATARAGGGQQSRRWPGVRVRVPRQRAASQQVDAMYVVRAIRKKMTCHALCRNLSLPATKARLLCAAQAARKGWGNAV